MSAGWDCIPEPRREGQVRPELHKAEFARWERQLRRDREPWWLFCGISTPTAVFICVVCSLAFVVAVLASGAH